MEGQTFAQRYGLFACIQCGKCAGGCPLSLKSPLNVRRLIYEALINAGLDIHGKEEIWDCTTCSTCSIRCPKEVGPVDVIIGMRGIMVEGGRVQPTIRDALESTFKHGNPWGRVRSKRSEWTQGLNIKDIAAGEETERCA